MLPRILDDSLTQHDVSATNSRTNSDVHRLKSPRSPTQAYAAVANNNNSTPPLSVYTLRGQSSTMSEHYNCKSAIVTKTLFYLIELDDAKKYSLPYITHSLK